MEITYCLNNPTFYTAKTYRKVKAYHETILRKKRESIKWYGYRLSRERRLKDASKPYIKYLERVRAYCKKELDEIKSYKIIKLRTTVEVVKVF